jgi:hypothetical protein
MCTVVILRRSGHAWPVIVGANRDEMADRPWRPPARHWPDRDNVVAGLDELAGGTWMGLNDEGVVACILNRAGSLGPVHGKRSRGELVLEALDHADAASAAEALGHLDPGAYRTFNLIVADNRDAFVLSHRDPSGSLPIDVARVPEGVSMLTAHDLNDLASPRTVRYRPLFAEAPPPDPDRSDWSAWETLLASRGPEGGDRQEALNIVTDFGFGTTSSSLLALASMDRPEVLPVWRFAAGRPDEAPWELVALS